MKAIPEFQINPKITRKMNYLISYQHEIINITGCTPQQAEEIEDFLTYVIFADQSLGKVKCSVFHKAAKQAYAILKLKDYSQN